MDLKFALLASIPILILLLTVIGFRINIVIAGLTAAVAAVLLSLFAFGADSFLLRTVILKSFSLSLFVLLIIWTSLFLYNMMDSLGLMQTIAGFISRITINSTGQALLCAWTFAGFIEGIAGFGVPVAVLAPLMIALGFRPLTAVVAVLVGHSWAVTFGGMASAYYTIQLATGLEAEYIGPTMALLFALPIIATGLLVAYIEGGWHSLRRASPVVLITGAAMAGSVWFSVFYNAPQIAAMAAGLIGSILIWVFSKTPLIQKGDMQEASPSTPNREKTMSIHFAFIPYYLLIFLALFSQLPAIKQLTDHLYIAFNFPGLETSLGYVVPPAQDYAKITLFGHPAPIIAVSILSTLILYRRGTFWHKGIVMDAFKTTFRQSIWLSLGVITLVMMSLIMNDSGMNNKIASAVAGATGAVYPIISPFIGVLGSFMTGSNTNSNVMFGLMQVDAAAVLGISPAVIASAQSIGGSLGAAVAPIKILFGSSATGLGGRESDIIRRTLIYCVLVTLLVGMECWLAIQIIK